MTATLSDLAAITVIVSSIVGIAVAFITLYVKGRMSEQTIAIGVAMEQVFIRRETIQAELKLIEAQYKSMDDRVKAADARFSEAFTRIATLEREKAAS